MWERPYPRMSVSWRSRQIPPLDHRSDARRIAFRSALLNKLSPPSSFLMAVRASRARPYSRAALGSFARRSSSARRKWPFAESTRIPSWSARAQCAIHFRSSRRLIAGGHEDLRSQQHGRGADSLAPARFGCRQELANPRRQCAAGLGCRLDSGRQHVNGEFQVARQRLGGAGARASLSRERFSARNVSHEERPLSLIDRHRGDLVGLLKGAGRSRRLRQVRFGVSEASGFREASAYTPEDILPSHGSASPAFGYAASASVPDWTAAPTRP